MEQVLDTVLTLCPQPRSPLENQDCGPSLVWLRRTDTERTHDKQKLTAYMESILPADRDAMDAARRRQAELAKPPGSLGALEDMSIRLAGILRTPRPRKIDRCRVTVLAADNGVVAEGVSCAPSP